MWIHWARALTFGLMLGIVRCQDYTDTCPDKNGFFADAVQCDRYYECKDGQIIDQLCPDGLVFDESSFSYAKCSFPFSVDCSERPELQKAQSTPLCPRRNGYFPHEDPQECGKFYYCSDGVANPITCPGGLIFSPKVGQCAYSDQAQREGCEAKDFFDFKCPDRPELVNAHPRYPDPLDCQFFYVCIDGTQPRRTPCGPGLVYNNETASCERQETVKDPVCRNWYNETYLESLSLTVAPPTGIPLTEQQAKDRVVVRRRKPVERPAQPSGGGGGDFVQPAVADLNPARVRDSRIPLSAAVQQQQHQQQQQQPAAPRQKVRTRVSLPKQPEEITLDEGFEPGPPKFTLSSDEDIQRFRDANRFSPQAGQGNRLTVLSVSNDDRARPPPSQPEFEEPAAAPAQSNRFHSRRPAAPAPLPESDEEFVEEERPAVRAPAPARGDVPRQRLQVTQIRVQPQEVDENPAEFENFQRVPLTRQRSRGQQG